MNSEDLKKLQHEWYEENAPFGRSLGYPECCIKAFCNLPPAYIRSNPGQGWPEMNMRYRASLINGKYSGFIPCTLHAKQILAGKITLQSLIKNRDPKYKPFPTDDPHGY